MKRIFGILVVISVMASLFVAVPAATDVNAAETITDEALFMTYPTYLSNSEMDEGLAKAEAAYYAVINSYSDTDETIAAIMTSLSDGVSIVVRDTMAQYGFGETYYEENAKKAATKYMQSMLSSESAARKATNKITTAYKTLKTSYKIGESIDKTRLLSDLRKLAEENDIHLSVAGMDKVVNKLYDVGNLKEDLDAIGEANELWKYVLEFTEIHAIEMATLDLLIDELKASGQTGSDLYLGLTLLKEEIELNQAEYVLKKYSNSKIVSYISKNMEKFFYSLAGGSTVTVTAVTTFTKFFADYIYVDAKADDIIQATMMTSFVNSIDICLSNYRLKFLQGTGTTEDIATYESLYGAYLAAHKCTLDTCYDLAKITDKFSLGGDCMVWSSNIETLYTYDKYIEWCKQEVAHDISNSELDKTTGSSTITDALNEETIASRLERVFRLYPAGDKWAADFGGTKSSLGYAGKVFNMIFDKTMGRKVENDYQYILTSNVNVRLIGRLEEKDVTEAALRELFANVRIGDVVITSGQYDYLHAMTVVGMGETGPIVYDVDSKYGPAEEYTHLIQKYEFPYSKMADAFSSNGKYTTKPGISVYRAIKKVNTTNSGTSLYYEEYDDSVNYVIENGVLKGYKGARTTIEIPDGVTSIAANCFKNNTSIKYVYMPDTITEIGAGAFYKCTNLRYVGLSKGLVTLGFHAFHGCQLLKSIQIPKSLKNTTSDWQYGSQDYIYNYYRGPFYESGLETVTFEEGTLSVVGSLFYGANNLKNVSLVNTMVSIDYGAFYGCTSLEDIVIPDTVTKIGEWAFSNCTNLNSVKLSKSLESLGFYVFKSCPSLKNMHIPKSLKSTSDDWQYGATENIANYLRGPFYESGLETVTFEEGTLSVVGSLFYGANNLKNVSLVDTMISIDYGAFYGCSSLEKIVIPDTITNIKEWTFSNCTNLNNIKLSKSLETLGYYAFKDCSSLKTIEIPKALQNTTQKWLYGSSYYTGPFYNSGLETVSFENNTTKVIKNLFHNATNLKNIIWTDTINTIEMDAFSYCTSLAEITIPDTVLEIKQGSFMGCSGLKKVTLSNSISILPSYVFSGCSLLEDIEITSNITSINTETFKNCTTLKSIVIPDNVISLGDSSFYGCSSLEKIKLSDKIKILPVNTFYNCANLYEVNIPIDLEEIKNNAFYGCSSLSNIKLNKSLKTIGNKAFYECAALSLITIPENVTSIGSSAFQNCDALTKAEIKVSGTIGSNAFYDCDLLESINIGDKVTSIGTNICYGCDKLTDIKLGGGITTIPDSAFRLCQSLETVTIPRFCTTIAANAFAENTKLKSAYIPVSATSIQSNSFSYPNIMSIYGKTGSYANEYAEERGFTFVSVDAPITTLAYPESSMNIGYRATVTPDMQIMPEFDTDTITFTSGDTNIATVSASGAVYGKSYGTTTITMTTESGLSDSIEVTVVRPATSVTLNKEGLELAAGNSEVLTATISPTNSTDVIKWSSNNTAVAVVDDSGKITAISKGTANITATAIYGNKSATCLVTVVKSDVPVVNVTGIKLNADNREITIGKTYTLKADVLPSDATNKMVEWTSSNTSVADVVDGKITAKSLGTATITAKTVSGGFTATCTVTVVPKVEITAFNAANYGPYAFINMSAVNVPANAKVFIASYGSDGKLLEIQSPAMTNGAASAIFQTASVEYYKALIWKTTATPCSDAKECTLQ